MNMNAQQLIKFGIIKLAYTFNPEAIVAGLIKTMTDVPVGATFTQLIDTVTAETIDNIYESLRYDEDDKYKTNDSMQDAYYEFRTCGQEIDIPTVNWSRHYEIDTMATKVKGQWFCWDYYHGGGKHGEPEEA